MKRVSLLQTIYYVIVSFKNIFLLASIIWADLSGNTSSLVIGRFWSIFVVSIFYRVATHQKLKNFLTFPWLFTDFWTIFNDLKLVWWMIKKHWKPLIKTTIPANITQIDHFSWCFSDRKYNPLTFHWLLQTSRIFPDLLQNSLTFPQLTFRNFCFSLSFPDCGNPVLRYIGAKIMIDSSKNCNCHVVWNFSGHMFLKNEIKHIYRNKFLFCEIWSMFSLQHPWLNNVSWM